VGGGEWVRGRGYGMKAGCMVRQGEREEIRYVPVRPLEEGCAVPCREQGVADVDVVERVLGVDPFVLEVVDGEVDVLRHEVGLYGR